MLLLSIAILSCRVTSLLFARHKLDYVSSVSGPLCLLLLHTVPFLGDGQVAISNGCEELLFLQVGGMPAVPG